MLIEIIIALLFGCVVGTFTGLIPGIHINLISLLLLSFSISLLNIFSPIVLIVFIVSLSITHTFLDFIPSIFLGAPDEDSILSVLPGHRLLLNKRGYEAIVLTLKGSLTSIFIILILTPLFIFLLPKYYPYIQNIIPLILIIASFYLIFNEEKKLTALIIFLLSGFLGIISFNINISEPFLPLLTGLFGASNIIISIKNKIKIPQQRINKVKINKKPFLKSITASLIASPLASFLPGLGSSQSAVIGSEISGENESLNEKEFLFLLGMINTIVMGLSFITFYSIKKTRTGAAVAVSELIPELTLNHLFIILITIIFSGLLSFLIGIKISKIIAKNIHKMNYSKLSLFVLIILFILVFLFSDFFNLIGGLKGIFLFIISTSLGISCILLRIKRMHLMGCLLIPTIILLI